MFTRQNEAEGSCIDWAAILAGGVVALAMSFLLISFGAGLGLSLTSPYHGEGVSAAWLAIAAGIWFAWVMVSGFGAGGYLCGRMRRRARDAIGDEVVARDGTHGLMVWATGALVSTVLAATGMGGLLGAGSSAVGTATDIAAEVASSDYFANVMLRGAIQDPATGAPASSNVPTNETSPSVGAIVTKGWALTSLRRGADASPLFPDQERIDTCPHSSHGYSARHS